MTKEYTIKITEDDLLFIIGLAGQEADRYLKGSDHKEAEEMFSKLEKQIVEQGGPSDESIKRYSDLLK